MLDDLGADLRYASRTLARTPAFALMALVSLALGIGDILVRSPRPPEQIGSGIRDVIRALDPSLPLYGTGTVGQMPGFAMFPSQAAVVALSSLLIKPSQALQPE